jgi:hypothetical protein
MFSGYHCLLFYQNSHCERFLSSQAPDIAPVRKNSCIKCQRDRRAFDGGSRKSTSILETERYGISDEKNQGFSVSRLIYQGIFDCEFERENI